MKIRIDFLKAALVAVFFMYILHAIAERRFLALEPVPYAF